MKKLLLVSLSGMLLPTILIAGPNDPVSSDGSFVAPVAEGQSVSSPAYQGTKGAGAEMDGVDISPLTTEQIKWINSLKSPMEKKKGIPESVIGGDTRSKVDPYDSATRYSQPARATALITFTQGTGSYSCTGWFISKDTIATAGHCVHSGGTSGVWTTRSSVKVYPAYSATNSPVSPYGYCTARQLHSVTGWTNSGDQNYDYAAIKLNCTVGNTVGWYGLKNLSNSAINNTPAIINGYPGDKPTKDQWTSSDKVRTSSARKVYYKNDSYGGMSGSPVWYDDGTGPWAIGIHAYGLSGGYNSGTRIETNVYNNLVAWKNAL